MKIDFNPKEKVVIEEEFQNFMKAVNIVARLRGFTGDQLATVQLAADRSGLIVPDAPIEAAKQQELGVRLPPIDNLSRSLAPFDGNK